MEMTITRALAELKLLNDRIHKKIKSFIPIAITKGKEVVSGYVDNEKFNEKVKSDYQSIQDLIKRRNDIKAAIVKANATNTVKIKDRIYTVAEAIERKNNIVYEQMLLDKLKKSYTSCLEQFEHEKEKVSIRLDDLLKTAYGKDSKVTKEQYDATAKPFMEQNEPKLINPLDLQATIEELERDIEDFLLNVDFELSTSNSLNKITIEGE